MSTESSVDFNLTVKRVEFFPFEWSHNLLAVCLQNSVKIYSFNYKQAKLNEEANSNNESGLELLITIPFQSRIDHFSWSPKTNMATLTPVIEFAIFENDSLIMCYNELNKETDLNVSNSIKTNEIKIEADIVYKIGYDHQNGDLIAFTADNTCYVWNCVESKYLAQFALGSSGVDLAFHRDEKNKLMVAERLGLIRIYNLESLKPIYTLLCMSTFETELLNTCLLSMDWCQSSPEIVVASTSTDIILWNTYKSSLPDKTIENQGNLRVTKLAKYKDDILGYLAGNDRASKINILNYKSNQLSYQTNDMKLLSSFSFNAVLPVVAVANEQKLSIINLVNQ